MSDTTEIMEMQGRMEAARIFIRDNAAKCGEACQVKEYDSRLCKKLLAQKARPFIALGDSNAIAETKAQATDEYAIELDVLRQQYTEAMVIIKKNDAAEVSFRSAQSLLSFEKGLTKL